MRRLDRPIQKPQRSTSGFAQIWGSYTEYPKANFAELGWSSGKRGYAGMLHSAMLTSRKKVESTFTRE